MSPHKKWLIALSGLLIAGVLLALDILLPSAPLAPFAVRVFDAGSKAMTLAEVEALPESAWQEEDARKISFLAPYGREVWLHVPLAAGSDEEPLVAELATHTIRQLDFHLLEDGHEIARSQQGMDRAVAFKVYQTPNQAFTFRRSATQGRDLYIRAASDIALNLPLSIAEEPIYNEVLLLRTAFTWLFSGLFVGILFYNVMVCFTVRDRVTVLFCCYQVAVMCLGLLIDGSAQQMHPIFGANFDLKVRLMCCLFLSTFILFCLFYQRFVALKLVSPLFDKILNVYMATLACTIVGLCFTPLHITVATSVGITIFALSSLLWALCFRARQAKSTVLFYGFVGLDACIAIDMFTNLGLLPHSLWSDHAIKLGGVWETLLFSLAVANRIKSMEAERAAIIEALSGQKPATELNGILGSSYNKTVGLVEMNMSIMFIDIIGFSQMADMLGSRLIFEHLTRLMRDIHGIVKACNGTVDRSLGDGVLCFFGYEKNSTFHHHSQDAFVAAKRIQQHILAHFHSDNPGESCILPVRIGVHVANVLVGNVGGSDRIDFTVIGSGVNFASRLETACGPFKIMLSEVCYQNLKPRVAAEAGFSEIMVAVKHQDNLLKVYEYNPFHHLPGALRKAERQHMERLKLQTRDSRFVIRSVRPLRLESQHAAFRVLDFSSNGFRVVSDTYFGRKVTMLVELITFDSATNDLLKARFIKTFYVEVRWSSKGPQGYEHGLKLFGMNEEQRTEVFNLLEQLFPAEQLQRQIENPNLVA